MRLRYLMAALLLAGCNQSGFGGEDSASLPDPPEGPGHPAWGSTDLSCDTDDDCAPNETCDDSICMPKRCGDGPYASPAPLGSTFMFLNDKEIVTADSESIQGNYWVDGYSPANGSINYPNENGSWNFGVNPIVDVAAGNVFGHRPESVVTAIQGQPKVEIKGRQDEQTINLGFVPVAVATGDIDQDSVDEVIAVSASGQYAVCEAVDGECIEDRLEGSVEVLDVAAADIDGDGADEPVFLFEKSGDTHLIALNLNAETTGETAQVGGEMPDDYQRIAAGTVDESGLDKVLALKDRGLAGFLDDHVDTYVFAGVAISPVGSVDVDGDSHDITVADTDKDRLDEIVLLHGDRTASVMRAVNGSSFTTLFSAELSVTNSPGRIAMGDFDGDSPVAVQQSAPEILPGPLVPVMALNFPPYSKTFSDGEPYLFVGRGESQSEEFSDSVAVWGGVELGYAAGIDGVGAGALTARVAGELSRRREVGTRYTMGSRFSMEPNVDLHGDDYSVVMLTATCYHRYTYKVSDPDHSYGTPVDEDEIAILVPVGGRTTVWSSRRYNALADAIGGLPKIETPYTLGDITSYPTTPLRMDGTPIPPADKVFPAPPTIKASDVSKAGYWLAVSEYETNEQNMFNDVSVSASFNKLGFKFGADVGGGVGRGYSMTIGQEALFGGGTAPIPDNPETPEDEYNANAFTYSPHVYRQYYTDPAGNQASYYVLGFSVGPAQ